METRWDVVVVGAGLAGLAAGATAAGEGASVLVLDGRAPGGRASTDQVGRFRFNRGAHALYRSGPGRQVLTNLGVTVAAEPPPSTDAHGRLGDEIGVLPWGEDALARTDLVDTHDKPVLNAFLSDMHRVRPDDVARLSAQQWLDRLALPTTVRRYVEMQVRLVTFVADLASVSADLVVTQLRQDPVVDYLHDGWSQLVDALGEAARRHGATITSAGKARAVVPDEGRVRVEIGSGTIEARHVVLAAGAPAANAALLPEPPPAWAELGPRVEAAALDLGLSRVPPRRVLLGLDRPLYLSMHAPPARLAPAGGAVVHLLRYWRPGEHLAPASVRAELMEHARMAGIADEDVEESRYLHRMVVVGALPQPADGGLAGRPQVDGTGVPRVWVAGDWVGPHGHLADTALASGEAAGRAAATAAASDPQRTAA